MILLRCWFRLRCACDIPAHSYTFSFEPKYDWSSLYAEASDIKQYFIDFSAKYSLNRFIKLQHKIIGVQWIEATGNWKVTVEDSSLCDGTTAIYEESCDILINACGYLNHWRWPEIPGLKTYEGKLLHSADWKHDVVMAGKNVGLIGNGYTHESTAAPRI